MIAYFDTSAVVPLIVAEPSTQRCTLMWNESSRIVSSRLLYPEARSALARAGRKGRLTRTQLAAAVDELDRITPQMDQVEITLQLARAAGELAHTHALRGYDAVHLAAAATVADDDVVLVTGDAQLATAAATIGIATTITAG